MTSHFVKTISLKDWWLTKADNKSSGNTVAVTGIECAGGKAARVFSSAPIVERLDIFTLKTADGIFVLLKGPINKQRTCGNGFSEEVFKHFLIGFPFNWEECAEKCFQQGIGSEATADADLNPEQTTVAKMGNTIVKLKQKLWKDSDCNNRRYRPEHYTDDAQEAVTELQDDQNIDSVEERRFEDARSDAQNQNEASHATAHCQYRDTCMNTNSHESDVISMGGVRYHLRNREVRNFEAEVVYRGKYVKNVVKGKSFSKKTMIGDDTSTIPSVASLESSQIPVMTPLPGKSSKEKAEHHNFAASGGVNGANHAKNNTTVRSMSISGETSVVGNSMQGTEAQTSHRHDDTEPIPKDTGKDKNLISDNSPGENPSESKKRKRNERRTAQTNIIMTRSLLKKSVENAAFDMSQVVGLEKSPNSGGVAVDDISIENQNGRGEDENKRTPGHLRSASVNVKKRSTHKDNTAVEANVNFSPRVADKLENSTFRHIFAEKSLPSKNDRKKRSVLTRTTVDKKNCHDSARPTVRYCNSRAGNHSKAVVPERERKASQGSTSKLRVKRKLDYVHETTCTPEGEHKNSTSQRSILRTSRSGRLLLPTMEFWRNQMPVYDADHGISGIREGSTILKVKTQKTTCTPEGEHKNSTSQRSILRTSRSGRLLLPTMEFWRNQMPVYDADHGISGIREGSTILKGKTQKNSFDCNDYIGSLLHPSFRSARIADRFSGLQWKSLRRMASKLTEACFNPT